MRRAMKAIPLRHEEVAVEVLFEDAHLLAVNKPAALLTAPKHRWMVRAHGSKLHLELQSPLETSTLDKSRST